MTYDDRRQRGRTLCATLEGDIAKFAPDGLCRWQEARYIVGSESSIFVETLLLWEETGEPELVEPLRIAYDRLVSAWKDAANLFELRRVS